jgi:CheY-like chemotaxis protein
MFLSDYLLSLGYFVFIARDGLSGLKLAKEKHPDLILLDVQMPGMDGFEVVSNLRANKDTVDTPVIALTALAMPGDRERCISAGMNDYISKPIQLKNLTKMMDLYLQPRHRKIIKK